MSELDDLKANIRAMLKLIAPDHITPIGVRQIEAVLTDKETNKEKS